jgi:hypothetical protein
MLRFGLPYLYTYNIQYELLLNETAFLHSFSFYSLSSSPSIYKLTTATYPEYSMFLESNNNIPSFVSLIHMAKSSFTISLFLQCLHSHIYAIQECQIFINSLPYTIYMSRILLHVMPYQY